CARARLRPWPSTERPGCVQWPTLLGKRFLPTATLPSAASQRSFDADRALESIAHAHPRGDENDSAAAPTPVTTPRLHWYRKPAARSGDRTGSPKSLPNPCSRRRYRRAEPCPATPFRAQSQTSDHRVNSCGPLPPTPLHLFLQERIRQTRRSVTEPARE